MPVLRQSCHVTVAPNLSRFTPFGLASKGHCLERRCVVMTQISESSRDEGLKILVADDEANIRRIL